MNFHFPAHSSTSSRSDDSASEDENEDNDNDSENEDDKPPEIQGPLVQKQNREQPKEEGIARSNENVRYTDEEDLAIVKAMLVVEENNWTAVAAECAKVLHIKHQIPTSCRDRCRNLMNNPEKRSKYFVSPKYELWKLFQTTGQATPKKRKRNTKTENSPVSEKTHFV
jgi:hypothetical protein